MDNGDCSCCGAKMTVKALNTDYMVNGRVICGVHVCPKCGGVLGQCYKGDSYTIVKPFFSSNSNPADQVYFDLTVLGSDGVTRRHGWFNPADRCLVQVG